MRKTDLDKDTRLFLSDMVETCGHYILTDSDRVLLESEGLQTYIFRKLTSKHFRKWKLADDANARISKAISFHIDKKSSLKLVFEFGGYKLWRVPEAPEPDWAEYFMLAHYARYVSSIAAAYKPGVRIVFASDDHVVERMNNVPLSSTDLYCYAFKNLINYFNGFMPENVRFELVRLASLYDDKQELEKELIINFQNNIQKSKTWNSIKRDKMLRKAKLNFCNVPPAGKKDLSHLSEAELDLLYEDGAIWHDAFEDLIQRKLFVLGEDSILIFTTSIPQAIAIGTTKASVAKFWAGSGLLAKHPDGYREHILSPSQLQTLKDDDYESVSVNFFPEMKNFKTIRIVHKPLDFSVKD